MLQVASVSYNYEHGTSQKNIATFNLGKHDTKLPALPS